MFVSPYGSLVSIDNSDFVQDLSGRVSFSILIGQTAVWLYVLLIRILEFKLWLPIQSRAISKCSPALSKYIPWFDDPNKCGEMFYGNVIWSYKISPQKVDQFDDCILYKLHYMCVVSGFHRRKKKYAEYFCKIMITYHLSVCQICEVDTKYNIMFLRLH